eukprot:CAMPEP_0117681440 /NCGR_PEP_ID=MMETSP0804-20121206/18985_1 /TAXON_ID=1074897 /ORGANISM="Tetraselmis astigmatica, Strain CCMP880" /LENGTH=377 /DNA_ID=CAMNT_0005491201 /DNA_START=396 /DNA_END=1527 /DNA_ORIENTATION=-
MDCFRFCKCLKLLGNVMILMVLGLVGVSYFAVAYTYVGDIGAASPGAAAGGIAALLFFSLLVFMLGWSYFATVFTSAGSVPPGWHPFPTDEDATAERERVCSGLLPQTANTGVLRPRFCRKCQAWKPQRAHHCSVSNACILKMDHYCIWVVNCVGLLNYKFFLLFLFYTSLSAVTGVALLLSEFLKFFAMDHAEGGSTLADAGPMVAVVFVAFVIDVAFTVCLGAFLTMHWKMVSVNQTTIELYEKAPIHPWPYDKGVCGNWMEVFGRDPLFWLLPVHRATHLEELLQQSLHPFLANRPAFSFSPYSSASPILNTLPSYEPAQGVTLPDDEEQGENLGDGLFDGFGAGCPACKSYSSICPPFAVNSAPQTSSFLDLL